MEEDDVVVEKKKLIVFGKDLGAIPCYRESILYGIGGGIASGLLYFMFTSKVTQATNVSVGAFVAVSSIYWIKCRHFYFESKFKYEQLKESMDGNSISDKDLIFDQDIKDNLDLKSV